MATAGPSQLSFAEALRARVLIQEALNKLYFLTKLSEKNPAAGTGELTQFMGDEISSLLLEQRDLERQYELLIHQRGQLKGLANKTKLLEKERELDELANRLRVSNKKLCSNLKANPDVKANEEKTRSERQNVVDMLQECLVELTEDQTFAGLQNKVGEKNRPRFRV